MNQDNECLICYDDRNILFLNCGDSFCKYCLKQLYQNRMKQKFFSLQCPVCNQLLSIQIINQISSTLKLNEIQELLINLNEELVKDNKEKIVQCLTPECDSTYIIWKDSDYFGCLQCQISYCLKCNQIKHQPMSCIENLRLQQNQKTRIKFLKDTTEKYQNKVCPHCFMMIEKNDGCNFITCQSKQCNGQKYFCYKCGIALQYKDQSKHFSENDSYGGQCRIFYDNNWYDEDKIPQNDFACPQCQSINPLLCEIQGNIINCKSNQCKDKLFCKICDIEMNNKNYLKHLKDHDKIISHTYISAIVNFAKKLKFF